VVKEKKKPKIKSVQKAPTISAETPAKIERNVEGL
jgi:hypothetical protein